ncbi:hypothetical protein [Nocardiopsis synnemataformans]|uniref:hypothetical protein n=1 Tax=Nocardiopsis synnemataformans TaxID=61305 RepID=UPI003EBE5E94
MIGLALRELGSENAHHEFEHLCRHLARQRIASNVLPAAGPIAGSGDQGRDFETFHSYLREELPFAITGWSVLASDDTVVFACTIQSEGLAAKIRADVKAICSEGTPVDRIYVFATESVKVGMRHGLQKEVRETYDVALEILDVKALAELLAEPDLFWVAEDYLHMPEALRPPTPVEDPALPGWYTMLRQDWQEREDPLLSLADLLEIASGLRHATFHEETQGDLAGWLSLMEGLVGQAPGREVRQRARYEIAVATLRGAGDLRPAEQHVRDFFDDTGSIKSPPLLMDASILLQYCETACICGATDLELEETSHWGTVVRQRVDLLLVENPPPNARAVLLETAAHLALHFDYTGQRTTDTGSPEEMQSMAKSAKAVAENADFPTLPRDMPFVDLDGGMARLQELVDLLPQAPMFPIDTFAALFDMLSPALMRHRLFPTIRDGIDAATAQQAGDAAVADRCRDRAMRLLKGGRLLDALQVFHEAKVNWWHGDTTRSSLLAMGLIADIYRRLNMPLAAKKYALALAFAAQQAPDPELRSLVPQGLFLAATCDHQAGAWMTAAETTYAAVLAQMNYATDPWNSDRYPYIQTAMTEQAFSMLAAQQHRPSIAQPLREILDTAGFGPFLEAALVTVADQPGWEEAEWVAAGEDMTAPPFSDVGAQRLIKFSVLGLRWTIRCRNERHTVLAAEAFSAAVQVLLVDLALHDPLLLPGEIDVEIGLREHGQVEVSSAGSKPDGSRSSHWRVQAPVSDNEDSQERNADLLAALLSILISHSVLPQEKFMTLVEDTFKAGLAHKIEVGRPYRQLADLYGPDHVSPGSEIAVGAVGIHVPFPDRCAPELQAPTTPGPGYTKEKALGAVRARYDRVVPIIRHTLSRLLSDSQAREVFTQLREDGWKDWHLLQALASLVINARVAAKYGNPSWGSMDSYRQSFISEMNRPEGSGDFSIPVGEVTKDALETALKTTSVSTLMTWGLEIRQESVDPDAILEFLGNRYGYWSDDVEHEDFFLLR